MNKETLLAELDRLLDAGEPLLDVFPKKHTDHWAIQLPDNISHEMLLYSDHVSLRAWDRKKYQDFGPKYTTDFLAWLVETLEAALLGWRDTGVLR